MSRRWVPSALIGACVILLCWTLVCRWSEPLPELDAVSANHLLRITERGWPAPKLADYPPGVDFSVVDRHGQLVVSRGEPITDQLSALRHGASTLDVEVDTEHVGQLFIHDPQRAALETRRTSTLRDVIIAMALIGALAIGFMVWTDLRILHPFARLRRFAKHVAAGNLETPLRMDRGNVFGAFTEAFDLMRVELARAREREAELREAKRTLVAQLGHDIRTPLASILTTVDLLRLRNKDTELDPKIGVIAAKAAQIDQLLDDLFQANRSVAAELEFELEEHESTDLINLLRTADSRGIMTSAVLERCLVRYDPRRLLQVFDNLLENAAKYGAPPVTVRGRSDAGFLVVTVADHGPGVPAADLAAILAKGVRGSNSVGIAGSGLGLYTASWIMERMNGELRVENLSPGFQVILSIPLAGRDAL